MSQLTLLLDKPLTGEEVLQRQATKFSLLGAFFGFPKCCSNEFENNFIPIKMRHPLIQEYACNGFVPCLECAMKLASEQTDYNSLINPHRICSVPFKATHTKEEELIVDLESDLILKKYLK